MAVVKEFDVQIVLMTNDEQGGYIKGRAETENRSVASVVRELCAYGEVVHEAARAGGFSVEDVLDSVRGLAKTAA